MASPQCPTCKSHNFKISESTPVSANFKIMLVYCNSCGTVVGTMDYFAVGSLVSNQDELLKKHSQSLASIESKLNSIVSRLK